jgi:hypothetical protein
MDVSCLYGDFADHRYEHVLERRDEDVAETDDL